MPLEKRLGTSVNHGAMGAEQYPSPGARCIDRVPGVTLRSAMKRNRERERRDSLAVPAFVPYNTANGSIAAGAAVRQRRLITAAWGRARLEPAYCPCAWGASVFAGVATCETGVASGVGGLVFVVVCECEREWAL